ncbi:MAG: prohibitin family protein, partial [Flavobacteriaceae bacterium]|nr:prohibitin family protein [Flavobacteriaceae bacterium]
MNNQQIAFPKQFLMLIIGGIALIIIVATSTVTIESGKAGVLYRTFGGGVDTKYYFDEGFHFVAPWNKVFIYEVRQQELFEKMSVLSLNGLEIKLDASIWYQPIGNELGLLHKTRGENYLERVIQPAIRSATRSVVGRYTPEQIYSTKRDAIQAEIYEEAKKILDNQHVQL